MVVSILIQDSITMSNSDPAALINRLLPQAIALVEQATAGTADPVLIEALLAGCSFLEDNVHSSAPIMALERDVQTNKGTYHLSIRRLNASVPTGKFQILITRELASGLIY